MSSVVLPDAVAASGRPDRRAAWSTLAVGARTALLGALAGLVPVVIVASAMTGPRGAVVAALAGGVVIVQFAIGLPLEWFALARADLAGMGLALAGYGIRLGLLGALLWVVLAWNAGGVPPLWVALGAAVATFGWVGGMAWSAGHGRVPLYDEASGRAREGARA
ncbi:MAG: hypothetical protein FWC46_04940 [Actinomycetia bacterium]|nr:hypothetical protein [Actinomycetes bacterium]